MMAPTGEMNARAGKREDGESPIHTPQSLPPFTFGQVGLSPIEFQALPGPEVRALREKTMRRPSFLGPGGRVVLSPRTGLFVVGAPGRAPDGPASKLRIVDCRMRIEKKAKKSEIRNPKSEITGPMLFPRNALTSGPQACFFREKN